MRWFSSYLSERKQFVLFKGKQSELSEITTRVPQGFILGPLFSLVFMNDMPMSTRTLNNVDMYADDSTSSVCGKNIQEIELKLNNELQEISIWCDENKMVVNVEKTKIMIVTNLQKWQYLDKTNGNVCIKGDKLQMVENERLLGFYVDIFLTRKTHIHNIHNTIAGKLALLCRIKQYHTKQGQRSTTAAFYPIWTTAAHSGEMQQHQIASTHSKTCCQNNNRL